MSTIEYNLFDMLIERSEIKSNIESIDLIVFFVCFRIIIFCDEVHDFSGNEKFKIQDTSDPNITNTLDYTGNTVLNLRKKECNKNIRDFLVMYNNKLIESSSYVEDNYESGQKCKILASEFKRKNVNFKQFILNMRSYLIYIINGFNTNPNKDIINEIFKIVPNVSNAINDENCKVVVRFLTMNIFGITNMPSYMCSLTPDPPNIIQANKYPSIPNMVLFIDQIGTTKNYLSVMNTINIIVNQKNFYGRANNILKFNQTIANIYDAAAPTGIQKSISTYGSDYNIYIFRDSSNDIKLDKNIVIKFDKFTFIKFEFSKIGEDIALKILNYFENTSIYNNSTTPILGGTKGNASKTKIKIQISHNIDNHYMIPYKTMGDFLQVFSVKLFEEKYKETIKSTDPSVIQNTSTFITGDIICGYLGGILLENSILEKQTDESGPLISEYSLTNFYNINEIRKCFVNYHVLDKKNLSNKFSTYLERLYEEKVCYDFPRLSNKTISPAGPSGPTKTIKKNIDKRKTLVKDFDFSGAFKDCVEKLTISSLDNTGIFYLDILKSFLIDNFNANKNFDTEFNRVISLRSFRDLGFNIRDTNIRTINDTVKSLIKECMELKYDNSFGKYKSNKKLKLNNKIKDISLKLGIKIKTLNDVKRLDKIIKLAKKFHVSLNKKTIDNLKKIKKIHDIARKKKIRLTINKNNKRLYKTPAQLIKEIKNK